MPVLLLGETGTGKGLIARAIHAESSRASEAFVAVNCAAIPEALLESELLGHVKGAFTGASADRLGLFAQAQHGTLCLDEIAELSAPLQAKLLHVLETGQVRAVGSDRERRVDARVIAATHRDLQRRVAEDSFREDLLYRLDMVSIEVPALRARRADLPQLIEHFMPRALSRSARTSGLHFSQPTMDALSSYAWPGNVRELERATLKRANGGWLLRHGWKCVSVSNPQRRLRSERRLPGEREPSARRHLGNSQCRQ